MRVYQARQHLLHAIGADQASHVDAQALTGVLIDNGQTFELLVCGSAYEVVGPTVLAAVSGACMRDRLEAMRLRERFLSYQQARRPP